MSNERDMHYSKARLMEKDLVLLSYQIPLRPKPFGIAFFILSYGSFTEMHIVKVKYPAVNEPVT